MLTMHGSLHYQARDSNTCFLPTSAPVEWQLHVLPLDRRRVPEEMQRKYAWWVRSVTLRLAFQPPAGRSGR